MIHKVKHGLIEVVLDSEFRGGRAPDLVFRGANDREFGVFFAPFGAPEAAEMLAAYYDYYTPFEAAVLAHEEEDDVKEKS